MADDAVRISSPAFARLLYRHLDEYHRGVAEEADSQIEAGRDLSTGPHGRRREAAEQLSKLVSQTIEGLSNHEPMREICYRAGRICRLVADLNHPIHTGSTPGEAELRSAVYYDDFARYAEGVAARAPLVFYGWRDDLRTVKDVAPFALEIASRSERDAEGLYRAYHSRGAKVTSSDFDDRSIPFAVASLSYSRTVSDTANLWLLVWSRVGGDLRGTPYLGGASSRRPGRARG
ncbi:MAG: hypothetical protein DMF49_03515 [Acidobacteria bacterium]|nr:MAG: hypothetical protein DMF49_03515 [Acidobacteriota bacterium]